MCLPVKSPKLALSAAEWQMAASSEVILTKNKIMDNVYEMYGLLSEAFKSNSSHMLSVHPEIFSVHAKISRGENYEGMPWVMLDYPRHYSKKDGHFAIRCFFWWGHYFSISLQLSGQYLEQYQKALDPLQQQGWYVGLTQDPWNQQLPNEHWLPLLDGSGHQVLVEFPFAKAAKKIPVTEWPQVQYFLQSQFEMLMQALSPDA